MAFIQISGEVQCVPAKLKASTAVLTNSAVISDAGYMVPVGETSTNTYGVSITPKASTDSDYASATDALIVLATDTTEFLIDVTTGTATAALVGTFVDFDGTAGQGVDVGTTTYKQVLVTGFIDATHIKGKLNSAAQVYTTNS